jgi:hypothetical protein
VVGVPDRRTHKDLVPMSSQPLAAPICAVLTVLGFVFLIPDCASACSCAGFEGSQREIVERALSYSGAVFSGEVVEVDKGSQESTVTLRVSEVWKGPQQQTIQVGTPSMGAACGYPFKEGQEYLVYADEGKQGLQVNACSPTKPLTEAEANLEVLGAGKKPTVGGEALSDTSGGVSAGALVGVAGLVMAASLLLVVRLVRTG